MEITICFQWKRNQQLEEDEFVSKNTGTKQQKSLGLIQSTCPK